MSWGQIRGWSEEDVRSIYRDAVERAQDRDVLVEVGVAYGRSLAFLARTALDSGKRLEIYGVDTWAEDGYGGGENVPFCEEKGGYYQACVSELTTHAPEEFNAVILTRLTSVEASKRIEAAPHFVFIDADHTYESVLEDIRAWAPRIKPGGIIAGHDLTPTFPGVEKAVREHFGDGGFEAVGDCWRVRVP